MDKKKQWWVVTLETSYKENGVELVSFSNLYGDNRFNKLKFVKARMDNEKQINKMHKEIFYPLKINNGNKKNFIYWKEC